MKNIYTLCAWLVLVMASCSRTPQLGRDSDESVIAAMTVEEKVRLVVGTCKDWNLVPEPAPSTRHRPPVPEGYWDTYKGNTATMYGKVSGAAGVSYAIQRLGIPSIVFADGPVGLRIDSVCTAFPSTTLLAATRDTALVYQIGQAIGEEMLYYGVDILLAPGINLMRNPLCGRNYEYMSSDPDIAAQTAAAYIRGLQSMGVGACVKHFAANNQETYRNGIDVQVADTVLRGLYLRAFERVVKEAHPWTLMSSYNKINGVYASENTYLLTDILRNEWGFDGFVMTDWWAEEDPVRMQQAGNDMLMPGTEEQIDTLLAAVQDGRLDEAILDRNVGNILRVIRHCLPRQKGQINRSEMLARHAVLARQAAAQGMVLLKNDDHALPMSPTCKRVALLGVGSYDTFAGGTGSGAVTKAYKVNLYDAMREDGVLLDSAVSRRYNEHISISRSVQPAESAWFMPYISEPAWTESQLHRMAAQTDLCIITLRRIAGEGGDRQLVKGDYYLTDIEENLIKKSVEAFHKVHKKVVLILNVGSSIHLTDIASLPDAILLAWLPGQEAGHAMMDVLTGRVSPKGKLPMPFYYAYEDVPSAPFFPYTDGIGNTVEYREGFVQPSRTLYPVGYGLE